MVPNDTITSLAAAARWGVHDPDDLFGGVVPHPFVATKTITHARIGPRARAPIGWSDRFGERVKDIVLPGYSAFASEDARRAGESLLTDGAVRIKPAGGVGGGGQSVVHDMAELDRQLASIGADLIARQGVVLERHLNVERTRSIGLVRVGPLVASYFGTQRTTTNRQGETVYGGSALTVSRGDFDALEALAGCDHDVQRAIACARCYHDAALECFDGMYASRCNYDVIDGHDERGRHHVGVLEQSWRIGGASPAEVAALQALWDDAALNVVHASTVEVHGRLPEVPDNAILYFRGDDPHVGPIVKYAEVHSNVHP